MPLDSSSLFIRPGAGRASAFGWMAAETTRCAVR